MRIIKWVVSKEHVHLHIEYPPSLNIADFMKWVKWYSSRKLRQEFPELKKRYWWFAPWKKCPWGKCGEYDIEPGQHELYQKIW